MKTYVYYPSNSQLWDLVEYKKISQRVFLEKRAAEGEEARIVHAKTKEDITDRITASAIFYKYRYNEVFQKKLIKMALEDSDLLEFMNYDDLFGSNVK